MSFAHRRTVAVAALAAWLAPAPVFATSYAETFDSDGLMRRSETIVRGTVTSVQGRWTPSKLIETVVTLQVDDVYAGEAGDTITFVSPGGVVEGTRLDIEGAAKFEPGQVVVVFLDGQKIVGFGQGAFGVEPNGVARRNLGNILATSPMVFDTKVAFGHPEEAETCLQQHLDPTYAEGWQLRGATGTRVGREDVAMWRLSLVGGMEYRLDVCADDLMSDARLVLTDSEGNKLVTGEKGRETSMTFAPAESGIYFVGLYTDDLPDGVWRGAAAVSIYFR